MFCIFYSEHIQNNKLIIDIIGIHFEIIVCIYID